MHNDRVELVAYLDKFNGENEEVEELIFNKWAVEITNKIAMPCVEIWCAARVTVDESHRARVPNESWSGTLVGRKWETLETKYRKRKKVTGVRDRYKPIKKKVFTFLDTATRFFQFLCFQYTENIVENKSGASSYFIFILFTYLSTPQ